MNHGFDLILLKRLSQRMTIKQVTLKKRCIRGDCCAMTLVEAIVDDDFVSGAREFFADRAADVPGAPRHKRSHSVSSFFFLLSSANSFKSWSSTDSRFPYP